MQTRDVVSSSATILGLIITAFGILVALGDEANQVIVKNFALIFVIIVILFACSVIFTAISSLLEKKRLWTCALIVYIIGWAFLGTVMIVTLLGYAYGIEMFQIQLPQFNFEIVSLIASVVSFIVGILTGYFNWTRVTKYIKNLVERSKKLNVDKSEIEYEGIMLQREGLDINEELVILRTEIERETKKLAKLSGAYQKTVRKFMTFSQLVFLLSMEKTLNPQLASSLRFVYGKLSKVVHGESLSNKESKLILEIGLKTLTSLKEIIRAFEFE